jgi:hypothetical protein
VEKHQRVQHTTQKSINLYNYPELHTLLRLFELIVDLACLWSKYTGDDNDKDDFLSGYCKVLVLFTMYTDPSRGSIV